MKIERMAELLLARLAELGVDGISEVEADIERERMFVARFCGIAEVGGELDEELSAICVELAAARILERQALGSGDGVKSISMGDVSVGYASSEADSRRGLAESIYRKAIIHLAARRGIKW